MRILTILAMLLASFGSAIAAGPVFPASTNANQTFFGINTFTKPITGLTISNLSLAGGTVSAPVLTTSSSSNSPANMELATAGWVRDLVGSSGQVFYNSTNVAIGFTNFGVASGTNFTFLTNIPPYSARTYINPANGTYFGSVTTTNKFLALNAGIEVSSYLSVDSGGSGTGGPLVKPEIYVSYNGTNWQGDWDGPSQNIPEGGTNMYSWVIGNPNYVSTNGTGFYVQRRFKMVTQPTPSASEVTVHVGTNFPSHIHLAGSTVTSGNAFLAVDQTFTGINTFTKPIYGSGAGLTNLNAMNITGSFVSLNADTLNIGTVVVTNPPVLNLSASTNYLGIVYGTNVIYRTNSYAIPADLRNPEGSFETNAAFSFTSFVGLSTSNTYNHSICHVYGAGSALELTFPANTHVIGTPYFTNQTEVYFMYDPNNVRTNALCVPLY